MSAARTSHNYTPDRAEGVRGPAVSQRLRRGHVGSILVTLWQILSLC